MHGSHATTLFYRRDLSICGFGVGGGGRASWNQPDPTPWGYQGTTVFSSKESRNFFQGPSFLKRNNFTRGRPFVFSFCLSSYMQASQCFLLRIFIVSLHSGPREEASLPLSHWIMAFRRFLKRCQQETPFRARSRMQLPVYVCFRLHFYISIVTTVLLLSKL